MPRLGAASDALLRLGEALLARGYRFTAVTPLTHRRVNARPGNELARTLADVFGWSRPFNREVLDDELFELMRKAEVLGKQGELWVSQVRWASLDDGLLVHSRFPTNGADAVFFGPDTYRFVRALHAYLRCDTRDRLRIADIGCGAGPGALCAARARPQAQVLALDINDRALAFTAVNATLAGVVNLRPRHSDLLADVDGEFDLIMSNPPYLIDPQKRVYRHGGGERGAGLSQAIVATAMQRLAPGGTLLLYTGVAVCQGQDPFLGFLRTVLDAPTWQWTYEEVDPDVFGEELETPAYADSDRIAAVVLRLTRAL